MCSGLFFTNHFLFCNIFFWGDKSRDEKLFFYKRYMPHAPQITRLIPECHI